MQLSSQHPILHSNHQLDRPERGTGSSDATDGRLVTEALPEVKVHWAGHGISRTKRWRLVKDLADALNCFVRRKGEKASGEFGLRLDNQPCAYEGSSYCMTTGVTNITQFS
jgi:hypothetical protein